MSTFRIPKEQNMDKTDLDECSICLCPIDSYFIYFPCCSQISCRDCGIALREHKMFNCSYCRARTNEKDVIRLLTKHSRKGKLYAELTLSYAYMHGEYGLTKDLKKAQKLLENGLAKNNIFALTALFQINSDYSLIRKAMDRGYNGVNLLCMYALHLNVIDGDNSFPLLLRISRHPKWEELKESSRINVLNALGVCHERGIGVEKDVRIARTYYAKGVELADKTKGSLNGVIYYNWARMKKLDFPTELSFERELRGLAEILTSNPFEKYKDEIIGLYEKSASYGYLRSYPRLVENYKVSNPERAYFYAKKFMRDYRTSAGVYNDEEIGVCSKFLENCSDREICEFCGNTEGLKLCSKCRSVQYCSVECQTKDWKILHKLNCDK